MKRRTFLAAALAAATVPLAQPAHAATRLVLPASPRVLLVGDSYTQGVGASPQSEGYAYKIAGPLGWRLTIDGKGGTGYVNPGRNNEGTFAQRLWQHPADGYDLVVLQGSSNDQRYSSVELASAINMTLRTVRKRYPRAQILMLGPTNPYGNPGPDLLRVNGKLRDAARAAGVPFVDPLAEAWFVPGDSARYANPLNGHPNNAGHALIARRFVQDVQKLSA